MAEETTEATPPEHSYEMWHPGRIDAVLLAIVAAVPAFVVSAYFWLMAYGVESRNCTPGARAWDHEITVYAGAAVLVAFA